MGRTFVAIPLVMAISLAATAAPASAITRPNVIKRANHWVKHRIKYSQHAYYGGYRRDCSGFVSMAWKLKKSYTSSTICRTARTIAWRNLKPGDAVRRRGHVEIFAGWKNKKQRKYWALEESTWGKPALRRVKSYERGCSALRYKNIKEPSVRRASKPTPPPVIPPVTPAAPPSIDATPVASVSANATAAIATMVP